MKNLPRSIALTVLALGCVTLIAPLFTPPDPIYPIWLGFLPYVLLTAGLFVARSPVEQWSVAAVSLLTLMTGYLYLDSIYFNLVFSWQVFGRVQAGLPVAQLAFGIPTLAMLAMRRLGSKEARHPA